LSFLAIVGIITYTLLKKGMGLEKLFPLILVLLFMFLISLFAIDKISETTFATFTGVILSAFVTTFKDLIKKLLGIKG
jgi:hypothetical protein